MKLDVGHLNETSVLLTFLPRAFGRALACPRPLLRRQLELRIGGQQLPAQIVAVGVWGGGEGKGG